MLFLCTYGMPEVTDPDKWAAEGEPAIPNFPAGYKNAFIGLNSFKYSLRAYVAEIPDELDELADNAKKRYPGLLPDTIDTYVLETAKVAHKIGEGKDCTVFTSTEKTSILETESGELHTLWEEPPIPRN